MAEIKGNRGKRNKQAAEGYAHAIGKDRDYLLAGTDDPEAQAILVNVPDWRPGEVFRAIKFADFHVGALRDPMGSENSLGRHKKACDEILMLCDALRPHAAFFCGDMYHFKTATEEERRLVGWFLGELLRRMIVVAQPGNHDFITRGVSVMSNLQVMADQGVIPNLYMASTTTQYIKFSNGHDEWRLYNACCEIPLHLEGIDWADGLMYHGDLAGAIYDNGWDITTSEGYVEKRMKVPYAKLKWTWLGDIHKRQMMAPNACYIGSVLQTKFSEDDKKGFMYGEITFTKTGKWKSYEHRFYDLETVPKLIDVKVATENDWPEKWPTNCYIRLLHTSSLSFGTVELPSNVISFKVIGDARAVFAEGSETGRDGANGTEAMFDSDGFMMTEDTDATIRQCLADGGFEFSSTDAIDAVVVDYMRLQNEVSA